MTGNEIKAFPEGFKGFRLSNPANIIYLVASRNDLQDRKSSSMAESV